MSLRRDFARGAVFGGIASLIVLAGIEVADGATIAPAPVPGRSWSHTPPPDYRPAPTLPPRVTTTPAPRPTNTLRPPTRPTSHPTYTRQATVEIAPAPKSCK